MVPPTVAQICPRVIPASWGVHEVIPITGTFETVPGWRWRWRGAGRRLSVIMSVEDYRDGGIWWHVSLAHPHRNPTWNEIVEVKETFIGPEVPVMHLIPPRSRWLDCGTNTFHLWHRLDGDTYPRELHSQ